jgi:protein gp37
LPLRWKKPRMVFVNSMSDLFHEEIPDEFVRRVFAVMASAPHHIFQVLTKRPERARDLLRLWYRYPGQSPEYPLPNVWLGVSIENARHTWRADVLREIPAAVRFISAEPLLGSLLSHQTTHHASIGEITTTHKAPLDLTGIDWLIVGGESGGRDSRPMHPEWARELRDACLAREVGATESPLERPAFFFKQWGSWAPGSNDPKPSRFIAADGFTSENIWEDPRLAEDRLLDGKTERWQSFVWMGYRGAGPKSGGRLLDGREWNEMPTTERRT